MELTIDQALQQGVASHKEGKLQDAERLYRAILQSQPNHPDANHNLDMLAAAIGWTLEAFKRLIAVLIMMVRPNVFLQGFGSDVTVDSLVSHWPSVITQLHSLRYLP